MGSAHFQNGPLRREVRRGGGIWRTGSQTVLLPHLFILGLIAERLRVTGVQKDERRRDTFLPVIPLEISAELRPPKYIERLPVKMSTQQPFVSFSRLPGLDSLPRNALTLLPEWSKH